MQSLKAHSFKMSHEQSYLDYLYDMLLFHLMVHLDDVTGCKP
jgi:hypothetical protein